MEKSTERLAFTVDEFALAAGISRGRAYKATRTGEIPSITLCGRILIPLAVATALLSAGKVGPSV